MNSLRLAAVLALVCAPALAQMPPPAPMLHSKFIDDCAVQVRADELCRQPVRFEADEAERHLTGTDLAYWIDGQTLNIAARVTADQALLTGSIEEGMVPLSTRRPLWGAAYRLTAIDRSILSIGLKGSLTWLVYRGGNAPPAPDLSSPLKGKLQTVEIRSAAFNAARKVEVYTPPGKAPASGWPVVFAAPMAPLSPYAAIADALIAHGEIRPVAIVSLGAEAEGGEYVRGQDASAFQRQALFFRRELLPAVEKSVKLSDRTADRVLMGIGPGADWALDLASRDNNAAGAVIAISPIGQQEFPFRNTALHVRLVSGHYDQPYLKGARSTCNLAGASGTPCVLDVTHTGHEPLAFQLGFARAMRGVFGKR
jgi:enterochelin esterase family protein